MSDRNQANGTATLSERVRELRLTDKRSGKTTNSNTAWLPWTLCALLAVSWAGVGIKWYRGLAKSTEDATTQTATNTTTKSTAKADDISPAAQDAVLLEVKGYLIPTQQISISPIDVSGRVVKLHIEEGMSFKKGRVLAELDPTPYLAMHAEAKAQLAAAEARYVELVAGNRPEEISQAEAELDEAKANLEQFRREWERFEIQKTTAITVRDYEQAEANYRSAVKRVEVRKKAFDLMKLGPRKERLEAGKAERDAAKARLAQAQWKVDNCTITSPVTGVILTKKAEIGSLLNPVVGGVSTNLCDIADLRKLEVDLEVQERDISKIKLNLACRIRADAWPSREYEGYVERVMPIANRAKSVVPVRIKVVPRDDEVQGQYLKPEMGVTVTFVNRMITDAYKESVRKKLEDELPVPKEKNNSP